ncbi:response regulator transcription factor [Anaerotalea alkaliphila]|uniref:Response regulator transcription factor n=1 Tax=Anaerotalea alkaliphila TaxID=2662126 RepID=A0A7X5HWS2_9FIRM|nr:response regulator transcription factor [Anaerotalea alkaliphila]NDL68080.1 response regulator transcription factor [Anaerotalea alkaliphila]
MGKIQILIADSQHNSVLFHLEMGDRETIHISTELEKEGEEYVQLTADQLLKIKTSQTIHLVPKPAMQELTKREMEILVLIAEGMLNKEIGDSLNISESTVKNHVYHIFKKMRVLDRTQAAVYGIRNGIL